MDSLDTISPCCVCADVAWFPEVLIGVIRERLLNLQQAIIIRFAREEPDAGATPPFGL
jgi:hypothetical protein